MKSPELFPPFVVQHTISYDLTRADSVAASFPDIELPPNIKSAVPKRRLEFAAGRSCARQALLRGWPHYADWSIPIGPHREPVWAPGIVGSISHSAGYASAALADRVHTEGLGLDLQHWLTPETARELESGLAATDEVSEMARALGWPSAQALTLVFSAKESIFKCLFSRVGRYFEFLDARIVNIDPVRQTFTARILSDLGPRVPQGHEVEGKFRCEKQLLWTGVLA